LADACIPWHGAIRNDGYGRAYIGHRRWGLAHRVVYEAAIGLIPDGMHLHHACGNPVCINPNHLTPTAPGEHQNLHHANRSHCIAGHEFTEANTWVSKQGHRYCRRCKADRMVRYRKRELVG